MKELYEYILDLIRSGKRGALATIVHQAGSSPRGLGAQMVIMEDGKILGSVGGGTLEADVIKGAREVMREGVPRRMEFFLRGEDVADSDMICGGDVEVLLEPLKEGFADLYNRLKEIKERDEKGLLFTLLPGDGSEGGKGLFVPKGEGVSLLPSRVHSLLEGFLSSHPELWQRRDPFPLSVEGFQFFVEPIFVEPTLYIFGAGHIAQQIAPLAKMADFRVVVLDDRADFATPERFPEADQVLVQDFEGLASKVKVGEEDYLVIVTRGHLHDYTVLRQFLRSGAKYIGMIGSRKKRDAIYRRLRQEGFSEEEISRVHAPIGLDIGAETPQEIAISIVAELIAVRRKGEAPFRS